MNGTVHPEQDRFRGVVTQFTFRSRCSTPFDDSPGDRIGFPLRPLSTALLSREHHGRPPILSLNLVVFDLAALGVLTPDFCEISSAFQPDPAQ